MRKESAVIKIPKTVADWWPSDSHNTHSIVILSIHHFISIKKIQGGSFYLETHRTVQREILPKSYITDTDIKPHPHPRTVCSMENYWAVPLWAKRGVQLHNVESAAVSSSLLHIFVFCAIEAPM